MPKFKVIAGNLPQVLAKADLPSELYFIGKYDSYPNRRQQITKDLRRSRFIATTAKHTIDDYITTWLDDKTSNSFTQGNLESTNISGIWLRPKPNEDPSNYTEHKKPDYFFFAYFDDNGNICGTSIYYFKDDPTLWMASTTRNANAEPWEREINLIIPESLVEDEDNLLESNAAVEQFLTSLNSERLRALFSGQADLEKGNITSAHNSPVFLSDGKVDIARLEQLRKQNQRMDPKQQDWLAKQETVPLEEQEKTSINKYFAKIKEIETSYEEKIKKANKNGQPQHDFLKKLQEQRINPQLEKTKKQSFLRRNIASFIAAGLSILSLLGIGLTLSGVLAPLGLTLLAGTTLATYLLSGAAAISGLILGASVLKIREDEKELTTYQQKMAEITQSKKTVDKDLEKKTLDFEKEKEEKIKELNDSQVGEVALEIQQKYNRMLLSSFETFQTTSSSETSPSIESSESNSSDSLTSSVDSSNNADEGIDEKLSVNNHKNSLLNHSMFSNDKKPLHKNENDKTKNESITNPK